MNRRSDVDLVGLPFKAWIEQRDECALGEDYVSPGPVQFYGPNADRITITLALENGANYKEEGPTGQAVQSPLTAKL